MEPLDNWINSVLLHTLALRCLAFWEIKWSLYYTESVVLLMCYVLNRIQVLLEEQNHYTKTFWLYGPFVTTLGIWTEGVELSVVHHYTIVIDDYNKKMNSVDHSDHMLSYYETLKSVKWYRKLMLHLINMVVLNAFILNKRYGTVKMSHSSYREYLASYLITTSLEKATCIRKKLPTPIDNTEARLNGEHFIKKFDRLPNSKRKALARRCKVCNFTPEQLVHYGYEQLKLPVKYLYFGCTICANVTLCLTPCFKVFHSEVNYRKKGLDNRIKEMLWTHLLQWYLHKIRNKHKINSQMCKINSSFSYYCTLLGKKFKQKTFIFTYLG